MMKFHQQEVELQLLGHCGLIMVEGCDVLLKIKQKKALSNM